MQTWWTKTQSVSLIEDDGDTQARGSRKKGCSRNCEGEVVMGVTLPVKELLGRQ